MDIKAQRLEILRQIEAGELTPEEGDRWLAALEKVNSSNNNHHGNNLHELEEGISVPEEARTDAVDAVHPEASAVLPVEPAISQPMKVEPDPTLTMQPESQSAPYPDPEAPIQEPVVEAQATPLVEEPTAPMWRGWWMLVFFPGLLLLMASVNWMYAGFLAAGLSWGFWLSFIPFVIGILMVWLGWEIRIARWFHLHVHQNRGNDPHDVTISFPLPTGLISWGVRHFGHFSSPVRGRDIGEFLNEVDQAVATEGPMHIFVDDPDGDQVEIWVDGPRSR